jgi:Family of unknown function (DUF6104)
MYFTDRGIEELEERRGAEHIAVSWLAERLRDFVDEHPEAESTVDSLASWLARLDDDADDRDNEFSEAGDTAGRAFGDDSS